MSTISAIGRDATFARFQLSHEDPVSAEPCMFPSDVTKTNEKKDKHENPTQRMITMTEPIDASGSPQDIGTACVASWALVLKMYTGRSDVLFGCCISGQSFKAQNFRVAQASVSSSVVVKDLLTIVDDGFNAAADDLSVAKAKAGEQRMKKCNTLVVFTRAEGKTINEKIDISHHLQLCGPISLIINIVSLNYDNLHIKLKYDSFKISAERARQTRTIFARLVRCTMTNPREKVLGLDIYSAADRERFKKRLAAAPPTVERTIYSLFEEYVARQPDAIAVHAWDQSLTYAQLNNLSGRLARYIGLRGDGADNIVPIAIERSSWVLVAIMGVLKAGGTFVLLDPSSPEARLAEIVGQVKAKVVIKSANFHLPYLSRVGEIMNIEDVSLWPAFDDRRHLTTSPYSAAYVIFTSGSTGTPKGVVIEQASYLTGALCHGKVLGFSRKTRCLQFASYAFDACLVELLTTLMHGGCVCIPSEHQRQNNLAAAIEELNVNLSILTPTMARVLDPDGLKSLKVLCLGGEAIAEDIVKKWSGRVRLYNGYGPAECAIISSIKEIHPNKPFSQTIGLPVGCSCWVVNTEDHNLLAPTGVIGELIIQGPIVGRGYLSAEQSKTVFIDPPHWLLTLQTDPKQKLYKTGDLGYYNKDGTLTFVGRKDRQLKILGQRLEAAEVEFQIRQAYPTIFDVVVEIISPGGNKSNDMLAAFVVPFPRLGSANTGKTVVDQGIVGSFKELQAKLEEKLPKYMVPTVFVPLDSIPKSPTGKADRKNLAAMGSGLSSGQLSEYRGIVDSLQIPHTAKEIALAQIWSKVLEVPLSSVSNGDYFLSSGGNSLKAMVLVSAAREAGYSLQFADVFSDTIFSTVARKMRANTETVQSIIPPFSLIESNGALATAWDRILEYPDIKYNDVDDFYPSTPEQDRMLREAIRLPGSLIIRQAFKVLPSLDIVRFRKAWDTVAIKLPILRTRLVEIGRVRSLQVVLSKGLQWKEYEAKDIHDEVVPLKIGFGKPLAMYSLVRTKDNGELNFIWTVHHAHFDGWSLPRIWQMVAEVYQGKSPLSTTQVPFNQFIQYSRGWDKAASAYWHSELHDAPVNRLLVFPTESYQPKQTDRIEHNITLQPQGNSEITMSTIVKAAYSLILALYQRDASLCALGETEEIIFRTTSMGRSIAMPGIQDVMGPTLASVPIRVRIDFLESVLSLLQRVQKQGIDMIPYEHRGLEQIRCLSARAREACHWKTPYLITQPDSWSTEVPGLEKLDSKWCPSQTPLSMCCILKDDGIRVYASFDKNVIAEDVVQDMVERLEDKIVKLLESMRDDGGMTIVVDLFD